MYLGATLGAEDAEPKAVQAGSIEEARRMLDEINEKKGHG